MVILELDHIEPKSRGGKDDINNYITACFDCNRGKRDIPLKKIPPQLQETLEVLKEKESKLLEYRKFISKIEKRINVDIAEISAVYSGGNKGWDFSDQFKNASLRRFLKLLPKHIIIESLQTAMEKFPHGSNRAIPYFCGVCWNKIKGTTYDGMVGKSGGE